MPAPTSIELAGTIVRSPSSGLARGLGAGVIWLTVVAIISFVFLEVQVLYFGYTLDFGVALGLEVIDPLFYVVLVIAAMVGLLGLTFVVRPDTNAYDWLAILLLVAFVASPLAAILGWRMNLVHLRIYDWAWIAGVLIGAIFAFAGDWLSNYRDEFDTSASSATARINVPTAEILAALGPHYTFTVI